MGRYFSPALPPIASQSISRDMRLAQARAFRFSPFCLRGEQADFPSLRASREHILIVRVLRARRAPGHSPPNCSHFPQPLPSEVWLVAPPDALRVHRPCRLVHPLDPSSDLQKSLCSPTALLWLAICRYYQDAEKVRRPSSARRARLARQARRGRVDLVHLVCLVFWLKETNQMNQINRINKTNWINLRDRASLRRADHRSFRVPASCFHSLL